MSTPLVWLGLITLVFNLGGGLIAPALPLYARSLGADYRDLGLIGASHGLAFAALTIPLGRASDRFGRRALLLLSALAVGAAAMCYLVSHRVLGLVVGKLIEAAGWAAFWPALEAWVAEVFGPRAGTAMGVSYGAYAAAFVIGTSAAGFIIEAAGLRVPFAIYAVTSVVAVGLVLVMPGTHTTGDSRGREVTRPFRLAGISEATARQQRVLAYGTGFVYVFGLGTVLSFLPVFAVDRGLTPRVVGLLFGSYWVARLLASLSAGRVSDHMGRRAVLVPAMLVGAAGAILVAAPLGASALFIGTVALGLTAGACAPTCVGLIADHVRPADRGIAMGLFEAACGVSFIVAGFVGGQAAEAFGPWVPYLLTAALALGWTPVLVRALSVRHAT
ncbi:MAG: MFS transporter [Candidatus Rokuibacteriota bacterium]